MLGLEKPVLKYVDGKLVIMGAFSVDADKDLKPSAKISLALELDAIEAVGEIVKNEIPQWLKDLISSKENKTQVEA